MTPLARSIVVGGKQNDPQLNDLVERLLPCQFFELTDVEPLLRQMAWDAAYGACQVSGEDIFLPAEPCFLEFSSAGQRTGWLLETINGQIYGTEVWGHIKAWFDLADPIPLFAELKGGLIVHPLEVWGCQPDGPDGEPCEKRFPLYNKAFLALALGLINTPRLIGRRQHMPDAKLERTVIQRNQLAGRYAVRAWTEILLKVRPTVDASGEPSREAHLTGQKAMHFCRAHLRMKLGRLEVVRGHWRGNPALGVKRSRYKVSGAANGRRSA